MTTNAEQPDQPPAASPPPDDSKKRRNQGIPYTLRRIQIIDGLILAAIIAVFSIQQETNRKVDQLLAQDKAEKDVAATVEAADPVIRKARYELELNAVREHVRSVDGRVNKLEDNARRE